MRAMVVVAMLAAVGCGGAGGGNDDAVFVEKWTCLPYGLGCIESVDRTMADTYGDAAAECARTGNTTPTNAQWGELWHVEGGPGDADPGFTSPISTTNPGGDLWVGDVGGVTGSLGIFSWRGGLSIVSERPAAVRCAREATVGLE